MKQKYIYIENRLVVAKKEGAGGRMEWEVGTSRCKLLYIKWINNKVLPYSTENCKALRVYISGYIFNILGYIILEKNIYMTELLCCTAEINIL